MHRLPLLAALLLLAACTPARGGGGGSGNGSNGSGTGPGSLPCNGPEVEYVDVFLLPDPGAGAFVQIRVDTVSAATTFDPFLEVYGDPDLDEDIAAAYDSFPCTFPPPEYECPEVQFETGEAGNLYLLVGDATPEQCTGSRVDYELDVQVNGQEADGVELIEDDRP